MRSFVSVGDYIMDAPHDNETENHWPRATGYGWVRKRAAHNMAHCRTEMTRVKERSTGVP